MADYNKATNFTAKDGLPTGNAGKIVKGTEIDTEFTAISNAIASKADINSPALTGTPTGPTASAGTNTTQLATTAFTLANSVPTGVINMWGTGTAPTGYLLCAGAAVSRSTYAALFAVIGTTFGVGDGTTTFNVPNYTNRFPYGTTVASTGGTADAVVVSHTHAITDSGHTHTGTYFDGAPQASGAGPTVTSPTQFTASVSIPTATTGITNQTTGVSGTNANLPPYLGINFIIKT